MVFWAVSPNLLSFLDPPPASSDSKITRWRRPQQTNMATAGVKRTSCQIVKTRTVGFGVFWEFLVWFLLFWSFLSRFYLGLNMFELFFCLPRSYLCGGFARSLFWDVLVLILVFWVLLEFERLVGALSQQVIALLLWVIHWPASLLGLNLFSFDFGNTPLVRKQMASGPVWHVHLLNNKIIPCFFGDISCGM